MLQSKQFGISRIEKKYYKKNQSGISPYGILVIISMCGFWG